MNWRLTSAPPRPATSASPWTTKNASTPTRTVTKIRWSPLVSLAPTTFKTANATVSATASGLIGTSR